MLPASSGRPEQLRLVGIQLKSVGLHPVCTSSVHADRCCCRSSIADGLNDHISAYHQHTNRDGQNRVVLSDQLAQQCTI